ncbi:hypothetical protein ACQKK2_26695 [Bacillus paranthracis]|uniref:hypothetical protein n=1 Tax=Bacillus paranthracis TaxID=2026186 RepID=UPI0020C8D705|nr:hypothetical protein [Bacillus paranthracis]UTO07137.1 hypothetical protein NLJ82_18350 [Bacillus paranthracis]
MGMRNTFMVFQYEVTSEKIQQITSEEKREGYELIYENYIECIEGLGKKPDNMNDYFSWASKKLDINVIYYKNGRKIHEIFFFSKTDKLGTIILYDFTQQKIPYEITSLDERSIISFLIQEEKINITPEKIIDAGVFFAGDIRELGSRLFEREYDRNWKPQLSTAFEKVSFNTLKIHKEIYEFAEMIKTINNDQFTLELEECIDAYENEKFFVCAAGLGSVLEHLLYLSIEQHVSEDAIKTNENSTAGEYIGQLKKEPFKINKRDVSHLKNIFAYRNSVSHFNKGIFSKEMCDHLLGGIKTAFDKYYMFKKNT